MSCHTSGGQAAEYPFTIAGTLYGSDKATPYTSGGVIELYTASSGGGQRVIRLEVDAKGNFYTTQQVDFGNGLWPTAINKSGTKKHMPQSISSGSCNSCHNGSGTARIWVP